MWGCISSVIIPTIHVHVLFDPIPSLFSCAIIWLVFILICVPFFLLSLAEIIEHGKRATAELLRGVVTKLPVTTNRHAAFGDYNTGL